MAKDYKQYSYDAIYCGSSFASQGCGPTSVADLLEISPLTVADWMTANGYATTDGHGTYWGGINAALAAYGAGGKMVGSSMDGQTSSSVFDSWKQTIKSGYMGVLLMHNVTSNYWTNSGHYIAVVSYDANTDKYLVYDPASTTRTGWHGWGDFAGNICCLYTSTLKWGSGGGGGSDDTYTFTVNQVKVGSSGNEVKLLQKILCSRGFYSRKSIDGSFGPKTETAVKKYQKAVNKGGGKLAVDGVCGPSTWQSLFGIHGSVNGSKVSITVRQVKPGQKSIYVMLAQEILMADNYYHGSLDMSFGPGTTAAVKDFQKKKKLTVDGICGPSTFKKLLGV